MANFKPIKTIESKLASIPLAEGNFIYCTDTGNIYIDAAYGTSSLKRRQGFPKHTRHPVDLMVEAGNQTGLDMIGDIDDPVLDKTMVFVKEAEAYFYFDASSTETPNGETVVKPEYITSGPGRWLGFTTNGITPTIGTNGNWFIGTADTGKPSRGATPQIVNKYWHIDGVNTNIKAEGKDGNSPVVTIDQDTKMWKIDGVSTGVKAEGADGLTPTVVIDSTTKNWIINGTNTGVKAEGKDGVTPTLSIHPTTKMWIINGTTTDVKAEGADGDQFEIINDYWYINGSNTNVRAKAQDGIDGTVVTIDPTSKNWRLNGADTGVKAEGIDGIGLNFRGVFNPAASPVYGKNGTISDTVTYNGSMWAYVNATASNNAPPDTGESNDYWVQIPVSAAGEGGGIPIIDRLDYNPERKDALMVIASDGNVSGEYTLLDPTKTGANRIWQKNTANGAYRLYYQYQSWSGKHSWRIISGFIDPDTGEFWGDEYTGTAFEHSSDTLIDDPADIEGSWSKMEAGMSVGSEQIVINKLPDQSENFGLKSFGTKDKQLEHGSLFQVLSENCIYRFDSLSYAAEDGVGVVRPTYILPDGPGRWIKSILMPYNPKDFQELIPVKNITSMIKYVDAIIYVPFFNKKIDNLGTEHYEHTVKINDGYSPQFEPSPFGWALKNGGLNITFDHDNGGSTFTIEFWIKFNSDDDYYFMDCRYYNFGIARKGKKMCVEFKAHYQGTFETLTNPVPVLSGEWYHVAYVVDTESRFYVNGVGCSSPTRRSLLEITFQGGGEHGTASDYYVSDLAIYKSNRAKYTEDFYPNKLPLYKQIYNTYIPQNVQKYVENSVNNMLLSHTYGGWYNNLTIRPGMHNYHYIQHSQPCTFTFTCEGFSRENPKAILNLMYINMNIAVNDAINDFSGDNEPTPNQMNVYEISLVSLSPQRFAIKKLGTYQWTGYLARGTYFESFVVDPGSLSACYHYASINGMYKSNHSINNMDQIFAWRHVPGECGKLIASSLINITSTSDSRSILTSFINGSSFRSGWEKLFIDHDLDQYNSIQIGVHKGRLLFFYNKSNMQQIETDVMFKQMCSVGVIVPGEYGETINSVIYCISQDGKLYTMSATRTGDADSPESGYEISGPTLLDEEDTRTWKCFATNFGGGFSWTGKPIAIADNKIISIDPADNSMIEEGAADANNIIVSGLSSGSGTYVPSGTNVWVTGTPDEGGTYPYYLMECPKGSFSGKWIISDTNQFEGMDEFMVDEHILAYSNEATTTPPTQCTWNFGMYYYGEGSVSVQAGNAKWSMINTIKMGESWDPFIATIAIDKEGKPYYLEYDNEGNLVSAPLKDENGANITTTGWFVKHDVDANRILNKTSKNLYTFYKREGVPYINLTSTSGRVENVVDYHVNNTHVVEIQ